MRPVDPRSLPSDPFSESPFDERQQLPTTGVASEAFLVNDEGWQPRPLGTGLEHGFGNLNLTTNRPASHNVFPQAVHNFASGSSQPLESFDTIRRPAMAVMQPAPFADPLYTQRARGGLDAGGRAAASLDFLHSGADMTSNDAQLAYLLMTGNLPTQQGLNLASHHPGPRNLGYNLARPYANLEQASFVGRQQHDHNMRAGSQLANQSTLGAYGPPPTMPAHHRSMQEISGLHTRADRSLTQSLPLPQRPPPFEDSAVTLGGFVPYGMQSLPPGANLDSLALFGRSGQKGPSWNSLAGSAQTNPSSFQWLGSNSAAQHPPMGSDTRNEFASGSTRQSHQADRDARKGLPQPGLPKAGREMTPTLRDLVEHNLLQPGPGVIAYKHSGNDFVASLSSEGTIIFHGRVFQSPTSFATSCRGRTVSGWREVLYRGTRLDNFRSEFCKMFDAPHVVGPQDLEDKLRRMTLQELINAGYLTPDKDAVMLHHKGRFFTGTLTPEGFIMYNGKAFGTPTGFAAHCTDSSPSRCRGWHRVTYNGHPLDHYRRLLCNQLFSPRESGSEAESVQARMMEQIEARRTTRSTTTTDKAPTFTNSSSTSRTGSPTPGSAVVPPAESGASSRPSSPSGAPVLPDLASLEPDVNLHDFLLGFFADFWEHFKVDEENRAKTVRYVGLLTSFVPEAAKRAEQYANLRFAYGTTGNGLAVLRYISDTIDDMQGKVHGSMSGDERENANLVA